ncbi:MAG TPA: CD225/dispanin family protein [Mycobacterium sp.]|nr:CD225/dispanin family protein [Mycobacterium sp.]
MTEPAAGQPPPEPSAANQAVPRPVPPPHHAGWAVASVLFFWPLAFSAFTHAFNVYPLWAAGDYAAAQHASDRVRRLGQLSLWLFGGLLLILMILYAIALIVFFAQADMEFGRHRYR